MKIYQETSAIENCYSNIGTQYALFAFSGAVPQTATELPFAENETLENLLKSSIACCEVLLTYGNLERTYGKFNFVRNISDAGIYSEVPDVAGHYEMVTRIQIDPSLPIAQLQRFTNYYNISQYFGPQAVLGKYVEYEAKEAFVLKKLYVEYTANQFYGPGAEVQGYNESTSSWETVHTFAKSGYTALHETYVDVIGNTLSAKKYRIIVTDLAVSSITHMPNLKFLTDTQPSGSNVSEEITWCVLKPMNALKDDSVLWAEASGPNDGKSIALQNKLPVGGESITLMNFKVFANVLGDIK